MYIVEILNGQEVTEIHGEKAKLKSGNIVKGINTIDSFTFAMLPSNPGFKLLNEFQTLVSVFNTNRNRYDFMGRVLYPQDSMDEKGLIQKSVTCESFMGFLCDSQQPYVSERNWTVNGLLQYILDAHNSQVEEYKHFTLGEVTVEDPNDNLYLGIQRKNTWETLKEKLIDNLGGEMRFRVVDGVIYLDYLKEIGATLATSIELSRNMKSITKESDPTAFITRLIPLGSKLTIEETTTDEEGNETTQIVETEERLDISGVNGGKNYIDNAEAIAKYGIHVGYVEFDGVTDASNLLKKGTAWMIENNRVQVKYAVTALELSLLGLDIDDFNVYNYHPLKNPLLGIDDVGRIIKKNIDICEEVKSTIEIGDNFKTLTDIQFEQSQNVADLSNKLGTTKNELKNYVASVEKRLTQRISGIDGLFFYIRYSAYADGHVMTDAPTDETKYMGVCSTNKEVAPTDYKEYTWSKIQGNDGADGKDGTPGANGADGKTQYLHIKYSDDGETFTANDGETLGAWIGTLVDFNETDSTNFFDYTWKKFTEDVEQELEDIRTNMTSLINDCEKIIFTALESYVQTSNLEELRQTMTAQLQLLSNQLSISISETMQHIENVNGELQSQLNSMTKHFTFDINGFTIGQVDSPYKITIDNDRYSMTVNGVEVLYFDGEGRGTIPELFIMKLLNLFGFAITQDSLGNVNCDYVNE